MFTSSDLNTVRRVLSRCYLGDWWVLYQLGRNSNTHFFRYGIVYLIIIMSRATRQDVAQEMEEN